MSQFGISFDEALLDLDESDLEVEVWEDDDQQSCMIHVESLEMSKSTPLMTQSITLA